MTDKHEEVFEIGEAWAALVRTWEQGFGRSLNRGVLRRVRRDLDRYLAARLLRSMPCSPCRGTGITKGGECPKCLGSGWASNEDCVVSGQPWAEDSEL